MVLERIRGTQKVRRVADAVAATVALIAAPLLLGAANAADRLWAVLVLAVLGLVLLAVALLWGHDRFAEWLDRGSDRARTAAWTAPLGLPLGAALLYVAMLADLEWLGLLATVVAAAGAIGTHLALKQVVAGRDRRAPGLGPLVLPIELVLGGVGIVWALDRFVTFAWVGLFVALIGSILLKQVMADLVDTRRVALGPVLRVSADVALVGLLLLLGGASTTAQLPVLLGAALAFCGLSVLGLSLVYVRMPQWVGALVALSGAILIGLGWLVARLVLGVPGWASVLTVFVLVVAAWFVFRGEGIIAVVVVGFVAVWGMADGYSRAPADPHPDGTVRMLALGDSFIAGEGAGIYLDGTNQVGDGRNECRRAPSAYPYLVADELGLGLDFVACSGAATDDLTRCGQMSADDLRCRPVADWDAVGPLAPDDVAGELPQLANLTAEQLDDVDVVLLQIGGNDVGFSTIVKACLLPRSCAERAEQWFANVAALEPTLVDTYTAVRTAVGSDVPVVVVSYPQVVDAAPVCSAGLDRAEYQFVVAFTEALDAAITRAAATAGVTVWPGADVFAGRRLCDRRPAVNHLDLDPPNGAPLMRMAPATWVHNSMHPNEAGHRLIADQLTPFVTAQLTADLPTQSVPPPAPPPEPAAPADAAAADDLLTDGQWITDELYRTIRSLVAPIVLVLLGSITLAIGLVNLDWFELLRPGRGWWKRASDASRS